MISFPCGSLMVITALAVLQELISTTIKSFAGLGLIFIETAASFFVIPVTTVSEQAVVNPARYLASAGMVPEFKALLIPMVGQLFVIFQNGGSAM